MNDKTINQVVKNRRTNSKTDCVCRLQSVDLVDEAYLVQREEELLDEEMREFFWKVNFTKLINAEAN